MRRSVLLYNLRYIHEGAVMTEQELRTAIDFSKEMKFPNEDARRTPKWERILMEISLIRVLWCEI